MKYCREKGEVRAFSLAINKQVWINKVKLSIY